MWASHVCVKLTENCVGNILGKYLRRKKENSALAEQRVYLKWTFSSGLENEEGPELIKKKNPQEWKLLFNIFNKMQTDFHLQISRARTLHLHTWLKDRGRGGTGRRWRTHVAILHLFQPRMTATVTRYALAIFPLHLSPFVYLVLLVQCLCKCVGSQPADTTWPTSPKWKCEWDVNCISKSS